MHSMIAEVDSVFAVGGRCLVKYPGYWTHRCYEFCVCFVFSDH